MTRKYFSVASGRPWAIAYGHVLTELLPRRNALGRARDYDGQGQTSIHGRRREKGVRFKPDQIVAANVDQASPKLKLEADLYRLLGFSVLETSVVTGQGLDVLLSRLRSKTTVLWGPPGVGKSSLLNALWPELGLRIGTVSEGTGMGRHTTVKTRMFGCTQDTWVVDTPGWRHFAPLQVPVDVLNRVFQEIAQSALGCRFRNCTHRREPDCAVRDGVYSGVLDKRRVQRYCRLST